MKSWYVRNVTIELITKSIASLVDGLTECDEWYINLGNSETILRSFMADTFDATSEFPQEYARHVEMNTAARDKSAFRDNTRCRYKAEEEFSGTLRSPTHYRVEIYNWINK